MGLISNVLESPILDARDLSQQKRWLIVLTKTERSDNCQPS